MNSRDSVVKSRLLYTLHWEEEIPLFSGNSYIMLT
ncbi:MAG: hypothetical protein JWQ98_2687 [Chlorobi bacterium]|nr:hypothetical protein [Chlorobiota bacterium]